MLRLESEDAHFDAVLPAGEAEMCPSASCYGSLRRIGSSTGAQFKGAHQPPGKGPPSTAKLRIDLVYLPSNPKYLNALPHSYAYAQPAFHTRFTRQTNSTPPPSVRTRNLRTQGCSHHKGSLR